MGCNDLEWPVEYLLAACLKFNACFS